METPLTYLDELALDPKNPDLMYVRVGIDDGDKHQFVTFTVSLSYMGLDWQEDFGFEFSKDLQRDMNRFYEKHHRIPTSEEYKVLTECHLYPYLDAA